MDSIVLPHCWVCEKRFTDASPPGPANKEIHHIIPRQAGGSDGPTVTICDGHHAALHKIALRMKSGKPHFDLLVGDTPPQKQKVLWLASRVHIAFEAVKNDPNKKVVVVMGLNAQQQLMIDRLKKVYPTLKSREAIFNLALQNLYNRHFQE
jgi:hypothetical protein